MKKLGVAALAIMLVCTAVFTPCKEVSAETFTESKKVWVIGDSISSDHNDEDNLNDNEKPITGWGNVLQNYVSDDVTIENKARSGRSSQSYTRELVYKDVLKKMAAGDYVVIQFGHNDEKADNHGLYTDPAGDSSTELSYKWFLKKYYIEPFMQKGARVILASSVVRYTYEQPDKMEPQTHEAYAKAMKELAEECQAEGKEVYFIDTFEITKDLYESIGAEEAKKMHAVIGKGDAAELDTTHYGPLGAARIGGVMAKELKKLGLECFQKIKTAGTIDKQAADSKREEVDKFAWR